jgi:hypothetical protein
MNPPEIGGIHRVSGQCSGRPVSRDLLHVTVLYCAIGVEGEASFGSGGDGVRPGPCPVSESGSPVVVDGGAQNGRQEKDSDMGAVSRVTHSSGRRAWQARWRDPAGLQRAKNFDRKVDAERYLLAMEMDKLRGRYTPRVDRIDTLRRTIRVVASL